MVKRYNFDFDINYHYDCVFQQQGRVVLDDDWNEDISVKISRRVKAEEQSGISKEDGIKTQNWLKNLLREACNCIIETEDIRKAKKCLIAKLKGKI